MNPPERYPPDDPREWLNRARSNLAMAKNRVEGAYLEDLCFEAQQAAESLDRAPASTHRRTVSGRAPVRSRNGVAAVVRTCAPPLVLAPHELPLRGNVVGFASGRCRLHAADLGP